MTEKRLKIIKLSLKTLIFHKLAINNIILFFVILIHFYNYN